MQTLERMRTCLRKLLLGLIKTGSEAFFLFICLDAIKFLSLTFFSLLKTIYLRVLTKPLPNDAKSPLPVDVRRSKTLLLKFPDSFGNNNGDGRKRNLGNEKISSRLFQLQVKSNVCILSMSNEMYRKLRGVKFLGNASKLIQRKKRCCCVSRSCKTAH